MREVDSLRLIVGQSIRIFVRPPQALALGQLIFEVLEEVLNL